MALLITKSNQRIFIDGGKAATIWRVYNGEIKGTKEQRDFCATLDKIYLNSANAPESYLAIHAPKAQPVPARVMQQARLPYKG